MLRSLLCFIAIFFSAFALPHKFLPIVCFLNLFWTAAVRGFTFLTCCFDCFGDYSVYIELQNLFAGVRLFLDMNRKAVCKIF